MKMSLGHGKSTALSLLFGVALVACSPANDEKAADQSKPPVSTEAAAAPPPGPTKYKEIDSPGAGKEFATTYRQDMTEITVAAKGDAAGGDQLEHMIQMKAGDQLVYAFEVVDGGDFWHEFHGHTADEVTFYKKAGGVKHGGSLTAPFDGIHGWYFENRSDKPVVVRLRLAGFYQLAPKQP